ncbi:EF-hand domain-containing protein [Roseibacterium sp. SDUM158017]|uniref:EF-hand domain-containing protein n=1 Tax=Roseicyclus salinarum TaxID=3036773 RepID=UPI00241505C5|nr:EF-hand domain-containing protein [Roseibacterium sp. SDUM158017]MDG4648613.1 EF-hand domain-containing protein [Roseibacterium sp. SDUM158017]
MGPERDPASRLQTPCDGNPALPRETLQTGKQRRQPRSIWKAALLGITIPAALVLPALAQDGSLGGPQGMFERFDLDGDGSVTRAEMEGAREARFAAADANGDGVLDREELIAAAAERTARGVDRMLGRVDADGDGAISRDEMSAMQRRRAGGGPAAMFERLDADGDGAITQAELDEMAAARGGRWWGMQGHGDRGGHGGHGEHGGRHGHGHGFGPDRG